LVGPNPHRLHSFGEMRAIVGRAWLVCQPCQRYALVPSHALKDRNTRTTTFSCSVCGGAGKLVTEDPHKEGLQPDPQPRPLHHPHAIIRLRNFAKLAALSGADRHKVAREALPQSTPRPTPEPARGYVLKLFPCWTFGDLATWGLRATIGCSGCHRALPLEVRDHLKARPLLATRLRCTGTHPLAGTPCRGLGRLWMSPADLGGVVPAESFVSVCCHHPDHTGIDASYLVLSRAPWQGFLGKDENFGCPGCGRRMQHTWHQAGSRTR
jgi:hypothetical protein